MAKILHFEDRYQANLDLEKKKITNYKITKRLQNDYLQDTNISSRVEQGESNRTIKAYPPGSINDLWDFK